MIKEKQAIKLYKEGMSIDGIMERLAISQAMLYNVLTLNKLRRKSHHLTDPYFLEVVSNMKFKQGLSQKEIAKRLNVCCATITNALRRRGWSR